MSLEADSFIVTFGNIHLIAELVTLNELLRFNLTHRFNSLTIGDGCEKIMNQAGIIPNNFKTLACD